MKKKTAKIENVHKEFAKQLYFKGVKFPVQEKGYEKIGNK